MGSEWPRAKLGDHVDILVGPVFASQHFRTSPPGIRLARGDNVTEGRFRWGDKTRYWPSLTPDLERYLLVEGDILFGMDGSRVGRNWTEVRLEDLPCLLVQRVACLRPRPTLTRRFLAALVSSRAFKAHINAYRTGSSIPHISPSQIGEFTFCVPPAADQESIGRMLGSLDDKIELNRRLSQTLESIARALFKSWFVDFDPVRAKAQGRDPVLPSDLAGLFPSSFEDSDFGVVPKGWGACRIGDVGRVVCGKTPATVEPRYYGGEIPFITIPDMHGKVFVTETQRRLSGLGVASQRNQTLPCGAICVSCIATPGLVALTAECAQTNQQINSLIPANCDETYFWFWTLRDLGEEIRAGGSGGSVLSNLSTGRFSQLRVLAPPEPLRVAYHQRVEGLFSQILTTERETLALTAVRDGLLPNLMSGRSGVPTVIDAGPPS